MGKITFDEVPFYLEMILEKVTAIEKMLTAKEPSEKGTRLITIEEASKLINLKVSTIYGKISRREIPHLKMDKKVMFEEGVLIDWVKQRSQENQTQSIYARGEEFMKRRKVIRR